MQFRNVKSGEKITVPKGSKAAHMLSRRPHWERVDAPVANVDPETQYNPLADPPARVGPGSARAAWVAYADLLGLTTEGLTRDEIIRLCDAR